MNTNHDEEVLQLNPHTGDLHKQEVLSLKLKAFRVMGKHGRHSMGMEV